MFDQALFSVITAYSNMNASVETKIQWAFKKFSLKNDDFFFF